MTTTENNNGNNTLLFAIVTVIILLIFFTSCSGRKVNKSNTKETEQTEIKTEAKTETKVTDNTKIIDTSISDEIEFIPIDNSKPIIVNGKSYFNARLKYSNKKNNISTAKSIIVDKNSVKSSNLSNKKSKVVEQKQIDKKQSYYWLLCFLLLIPIYYVYKKTNILNIVEKYL